MVGVASMWRITLLGSLSAQRVDRVITRFRTHRTGGLLAYLAYFGEEAHPRDQVIEVVWPESDRDAGRNNLSVALNSLRRQLEPPGVPRGAVLEADRSSVRLNPAAFTTDVREFEAALAASTEKTSEADRVSALEMAIRRYGGPLLPGHSETWVLAERERLAGSYLGALRRLVRVLARLREPARALDYARRAVQADPLREGAHRDVMRLLAALGQPGAALEQYQLLERLLGEEIHTRPSAATRTLAEEIQRSHPVAAMRSAKSEVLSVKSEVLSVKPDVPNSQHLILNTQHSHRAGWAPLPLGRFFGREQELVHLEALVLGRGSTRAAGPEVVADPALPADASHGPAAAPRLLTLTGPGGSG